MSARKVSAPLAKLREITARNVANGEPVFVEITPLAAMEATAEGYRADLERESDRLIQARNDLREAVGLLRRYLATIGGAHHLGEHMVEIDHDARAFLDRCNGLSRAQTSDSVSLARLDAAREGGGK